ncbi:hypothetical protein L2D08_17020 [Domibacillus sp. PGB-M46]|uniref:hypothetical protein n=1 Tax=Domibacillus sp. PGB-M46 TaxID=2910255 RepID=UPI001F561A6A|nr:hypothetical protein [Domibacillus sp. PGB-M46]MCI2256057.1 hypothetical protein [Domibacillus sp. PGB-M46]
MDAPMYCLAQDSFDYYVYGNTDDVMIFIGASPDIKWTLYFYSDKKDLIEALININKKRSTIIMSLL